MDRDLPYDYGYDEKANARRFESMKDDFQQKFKKASTEAEKYSLLLSDWGYAYFHSNPEPKTIKDLAWRYRQCFRTLKGDVPAHVVDVMLKDSPKYVGWCSKLTATQQYKVAKADPLQVYRFPTLFKDEVLAKVHPSLKLLVETMGPLGFSDKEFKRQIKMALSKKTIEAAPLPDEKLTVNF